YASAPIAALCNIVAVTQARHQHCPGASDARKTPPRFSGLIRKAKSGKRWNYNVKGVVRFTAVSHRVDERCDDLQELQDRSGPAVSKDDRQRVLVFRSNVNEVN